MATGIMNCFIFTFIFLHLWCLTFLTSHIGICIGSSEILCIPSEREALLRFKHHLNDSSNRLSSWNASNSNCCQWLGVVCNNITGHILQLHLNISPPSPDFEGSIFKVDYEAYERSRFGGEVNPSLVKLKHLNYLDLSGNNFGRIQIPSFLCAITTLTYLNLSDAGFYGNIPHQIGNLSNLLYLDLSSNFGFYGNIPHQIGNLSNLLYLDLSNAGFYGNIPHQIGNLSNLLYLDLSYIATGAIPYQIGNLTDLLHLDLESHPDQLFVENLNWLSSLSSLHYLDLSNANLSKSFDWVQTMQGLPSLVELRLSACTLNHYNQPSTVNFTSLVSLSISFVPKWISGLKKLVFLQLWPSYNFVQGPIPFPNGIQNLTLLENLDLSYNHISSFIPDWIYGFHHLKFLNLRDNNLQGTIPNVLGNLTSLISLDLSYNQLVGVVPTSLRNLCNLRIIGFSGVKLNQKVYEMLEILAPCISHGLTTLSVRNSNLSGHLTNQIGMFQNLVELDFSYNSIGGAIPRSIGKLSSLRSLHLSANKFNGNPFEILGSLSKLSYLSIDDNLFQGVVREDDLANLTSLDEFQASRSNLTLKVGPEWRPSFQASRLELSSWNLGPRLPLWIESQKDLWYLDMSNTGISDSIPTWFWGKFPNDSYVNLSHNQMHGELQIPNTLPKLIYLRTIDLSSNHFSGQVPHLSIDVFWLDLSRNYFSGSMTNLLCGKHDKPKWLQFLNVASNNLSGEIPDCWMMWPELVDVNIQSNYFVGNLPPSMASLAWLESLNIRNNRFTGMFPSILKNTSKLVSLDLGENNFRGIIPAWVGEKLSNLKILRLQSNNFLGNIPYQICAMSVLQILHLAQNNLSGNIPKCFSHFNAMMLKNRSTNSFINTPNDTGAWGDDIISVLLWLKGRDIEYRNLLGMVTSIDLSDNNLSGEIPREITSLDGLIYLNLSKNQLTGPIPEIIGNMISLESIDFSRNTLSGEIPETISNLSFLSMLDLSYNHLKGKIPTCTQLQTFEASNFVGNNLCGPPLPVNCSPSVEIPKVGQMEEKKGGHRVNWFFVSMAFGFIVGFWTVVAPLFISRSWRHTYFLFLDAMWYKLQSCWYQ